jgi:predicted nucleic acid-binding protein
VNAAVVDASVAVKWVVAEELAENANGLRSVGQLNAPAHWLAEAANALWAKAWRGELTAFEAEQRAGLLSQAPIVVAPLADLAEEAVRLANALGLTVYDTLYLALALERVIPLITADRRLFERTRARPEFATRVRWLGDLPPAGATASP